MALVEWLTMNTQTVRGMTLTWLLSALNYWATTTSLWSITPIAVKESPLTHLQINNPWPVWTVLTWIALKWSHKLYNSTRGLSWGIYLSISNLNYRNSRGLFVKFRGISKSNLSIYRNLILKQLYSKLLKIGSVWHQILNTYLFSTTWQLPPFLNYLILWFKINK